MKAIADCTTKEEIIQSNVKAAMLMFSSDAHDFSWGELFHRVENDDTGTHFSSILRLYIKLNVADLQKQAHMMFCAKSSTYSTILPVNFIIETLSPATDTGDIIIFHRRTKSAMISKGIKGSIITSSWKFLILRKDKFSWTSTTTDEVNFDGPTMLYPLVSTLNLLTRVGITEFKNEIQNARFDKYDQNLKEILDNTQDNYGHITDLDQTHQDYLMYLFDALLSSQNDVFNAYIQRKKYHLEEGGSLTHDALIVDATTKYNNMMKKNKWKQSKSKKAKNNCFYHSSECS